MNLPDGTIITWRSHDESISQRTAIDQARQEKTNHDQQKRRVVSSEETLREKASVGS